MSQGDFISEYLEYTQNNEAPTIYHRWSILTAISALLKRNYYIPFGHSKINPNLYTILVGGPGTKKNTAINIAKKLIRFAGYDTFAPAKTTKEKMYIDMAAQTSQTEDSILEQNLFGDSESSAIHTLFIAAGEFETFFGNNILDFIKDLGELWDYEGKFESKVKNSSSVFVNDPTISILGGITPSQLAFTFPPQVIGQGFFSRCLFIYGEKTREKITFPAEIEEHQTRELATSLARLASLGAGRIEFTATAKLLVEKIYRAPELISDVRFESYYNRRLAQLFKLCIIHACAAGRQIIDEDIVLLANTVLTFTETLMPKALGEFGKAKHSDVSHKVVQILENSSTALTLKQIWRHVANDLEDMKHLSTILVNLMNAEKIQQIPNVGFLPKKRVIQHADSSLYDFSLLTEEERNMKV